MTKSAVSLLALAAATPAHAQIGNLPADGQGTIVVTVSRSGDPVPEDRVSGSVTVLDPQALEQRQTRIVSDVLRDVPGVAVSRAGVIGGLTQVRIRGSESNHVLMLIDGIEVSDPFQGEYDFATLIADEEARVEVLRGQQSSLYGSDAIGGVINYVTATGAEAAGVRVRAEGGSFGTGAASARAAGVAGSFDYALTGSWYHTDGTPTARAGSRDIGADSFGGGVKLIRDPAANLRVTAVGRYSLTKADTNNSEQDTASWLFGFVIDSPGVRSRNDAFYGLVRAEIGLLDNHWTNAISAQIADTRRKGFGPEGVDSGDQGRRYKASLESAIRFGTGWVRQRVTAAIDLEREEYRNTTRSPFVFGGERHTNNIGLVGEYEMFVEDALSLSASIRHDENDRFADATTWRAQGSYRVGGTTRLRAAYGTGVKNPGYYELYGYVDGRYIGNSGLRPEKSKGWEAGIDQQIGHDTSVGLTLFDSRLTDEIYTIYPAPDYLATPANRATRSRQKGVELFATARPARQLRVDFAYTWLHAREDGLAEVRRPAHSGSLNVTALSLDQRLSVTFTARYNGRQVDLAYTDPSYVPVRVALRDYVLANLAAEYRLTAALSLFGRIENLFDERYEEVFSYATAGRAIFGGVRMRL